MTGQEWESICFLIEEAWPGEFDDNARKAWRILMDGFEPAEIVTGVRAMILRGGTFRPSVAEVVAEIRRDPSTPTFDEAWLLIRVVLSARTTVRKTRWDIGERDRLNEDAMLERAAHADIHPLVASFIDRQGGPLRLRSLGLDDPENEFREVRRRDLRAKWVEHVDVMDGREVAVLASGRRGELGRVDPLAALGLGRREIGSGSS